MAVQPATLNDKTIVDQRLRLALFLMREISAELAAGGIMDERRSPVLCSFDQLNLLAR